MYNHPSIIAYTIFNEGWGQFQSDYMYDYVKASDDTKVLPERMIVLAKELQDAVK